MSDDASAAPEADAVLKEAYIVLGMCFNRLHVSARARDGELCDSIAKIMSRIEKARNSLVVSADRQRRCPHG